jgi:hypothetical protein
VLPDDDGHPFSLFRLGVNIDGGPRISGPDTVFDRASFSATRLYVSVQGLGYYTSQSYGCSEWDFHCSRANRVNGGFFSTTAPQAVGITIQEMAGGPYAFYGPVELRLTFPDYMTVIDPRISAVPEPSTWAMLLIGFAGIGFAAYRRKAKPALFAA